MKAFGISLTLLNPKFRKKVIHIHDIQHILNNCDTSWKGEGFISGWEIATGMWKYFPLVFLSLWAMGYSLWLHPRAVFNGYKKGINNIGIIDLKINKSDFMKMELNQLKTITKKEKTIKMGIWQWTQFLFWSVMSQIVLFIPLFILIIGVTLLK
ncbi:hypothetical protein [uncultured Lacinutrix sp.]|uniref:hypothetical protein n=1 Tax=uncultured Lacinutrix sp. TaxID=574032 RepID=UPI002601E77D|nr:hypothetical protein [uncultured Lacinutrix sp.]